MRILSAFFSFVIFSAPVFGNQKQLLKKIDQLRSENKVKEALEISKGVFNSNPNDYSALIHLVRAYNDMGEQLQDQDQKDEAVSYFRSANKYVHILDSKFPNRAEVQYYRAVILGNLDDSVPFDKQVKLGHKVEVLAKKAIELDPKFEPAYVVLGSFYREIAILNSFEKAVFGKVSGGTLSNSEKLLRKAVELNSKDPFAVFELAQTLSKEGQRNSAVKYYEQVIALPLNDPRHAHLKVLAAKGLKAD